jgi:hypothetical protein
MGKFPAYNFFAWEIFPLFELNISFFWRTFMKRLKISALTWAVAAAFNFGSGATFAKDGSGSGGSASHSESHAESHSEGHSGSGGSGGHSTNAGAASGNQSHSSEADDGPEQEHESPGSLSASGNKGRDAGLDDTPGTSSGGAAAVPPAIL